MSVPLADLVPAVKAAMNPLGQPPVVTDADDDQIIAALGAAFWTAKVTGWFPSHRLNVGFTEIVNVTDGGEDLPREEQQIIVLFTVLTSWRAQMVNQPTSRKAKAGPAEVERTYSATVLRAMIEGLEAQIADLTDQMRSGGRGTEVGVLDMAAIGAACHDTWVR